MESERFDRLTRAWSTRSRRRAVVGAFLSCAMGLSPLTEREANGKKRKAKSEAKGKKGKTIILCLNGQSLTVKKSKKGKWLKQGATQGACASSPPTSPPASPPPLGGGGDGCAAGTKPCNGACIPSSQCCTHADCNHCKQEICQNGTCSCKPGTLRDASGYCGTPSACLATGLTAGSAAQCCSGRSAQMGPTPSPVQCLPGTARCLTNVDCIGGGVCRGFICPTRVVSELGRDCLDGASGNPCDRHEECPNTHCSTDFEVCMPCSSDANCGSDAAGQCQCDTNGDCHSRNEVIVNGSCSSCPANTVYCHFVSQGRFGCSPRCGGNFS